MNKIYKNLILFIYVSMFIITCDYRDPTGGDNNDSLNIDRLEISSDPIISIEDANSPYSAEIKVTPLDEDGVFVENVVVEFKVLDDSPGNIIGGEKIVLSPDSVASIFRILPSAYLDSLTNEFNFDTTSTIRASIKDQSSISKDWSFIYQKSSGDISDLEITSITPEAISLGEESIITAYLTGNVDGSSTGIEGQYIHFESLLPDEDISSDEDQNFGIMSPEYVKTDQNGLAQSTFSPQNQTGYAKIRAKIEEEDLSAETYVQVFSGDAISLELLIPSNNELMVTGGGGNETVTITAEIKDGFGNYVNEDYAVVFTIPCPFPIDGSCPVGDGDFSNDIMLNGTPSDVNGPLAVSYSTNGNATVTLNSGNKPGLVLLNAKLCEISDWEDNQTCDNVLFEAEKLAAAITTGPAYYGQASAGWAEAETIGGGGYRIPLRASFWDQWTNPIADSTNVYWYMNPEYIANVDANGSKIGNCEDGAPGQACTDAYFQTDEIFSSGQICAVAPGENGSELVACSGGTRCEDLNEFNCQSSEDLGCIWIETSDSAGNPIRSECFFKGSEAYCNNFLNQNDCESEGFFGDFSCVWDPPLPLNTPWDALINEAATCHYKPIVTPTDEQVFYADLLYNDGISEEYIGEEDFVGLIVPDDPICNRNDMGAMLYQEYGDDCESNPICSWNYIEVNQDLEDGLVGTCVYNGSNESGYFNPCVDCNVSLVNLTETVTDYCATNDAPFDVMVTANLTDAYGSPVPYANLRLTVFDATAFEFIPSDYIDENGNGSFNNGEEIVIIDDAYWAALGYPSPCWDPGPDQDQCPIVPGSPNQKTNINGDAYWILRLPNDNCHATNPGQDQVTFVCDNIFMRAFLLDPLQVESLDLNVTLFKFCE